MRRHRCFNGYGNWKKTHEDLGIQPGYHFKFGNEELRVRNDGEAILVYDYEWGDWIKSAWPTLQLSYVIANKDKIQELPIGEWHVEASEPLKICRMDAEYHRQKLMEIDRKREQK